MYESRYEGKEFIMNNRHLSIPVILGTTRKGRMSAHSARFMVGKSKQVVESPLIGLPFS